MRRPVVMAEVAVGRAGGDDLLGAMRKGSVWFDLSTNSPTVVREVYKRFADKGIALLDAPGGAATGSTRS